MPHQVTVYDRLRDIAHDLDATFIAGAVGPPMNGRMWVANRSLEEVLLPDGQARMVTLLIAPGGPAQQSVALGRGILDQQARQRLAEVAAETQASLYEGRLALLTPADWVAGIAAPSAETSTSRAACIMTDAFETAGWSWSWLPLSEKLPPGAR